MTGNAGSTRSYPWLLLAAALAGCLLSLPWLDERTLPAAWIGMTLWIALTAGQPPHLAFRLWLCGGLATVAMWFHWLPQVAAGHLDVGLFAGVMVALLVVMWDAFRFGVFGYVVAAVRPRGAWGTLVWPTLWVALEWVWPHIFPWRLGQSQMGWLAFCQIAEVTGVYGVSFLFMWGAAVIAELLRERFIGMAEPDGRRLPRQAAICGLVLASSVGWGTWRIRQIDAEDANRPKLRFALVQAGARGDEMLATLRRLSFQVRDGADLVVWGESSVGDFSLGLTSFGSADEVQGAARYDDSEQQPCPSLACPLLCGGASFAAGTDKTGPFWNSAFLIGADENILGRYHKRVLMPWGEYAVGQQWIPGLRQLLGGVEALTAGKSAAPLALSEQAHLGVLICYEDIVPPCARETVLQGASVLVNLNNLAIFGHTPALRQHQHLAKFRAIENRRWLVRCGTTGSTAVISSTGRVVEQAPINAPATVVVTVPLLETLTVYTRSGDVFAVLCVAASVLVVALAFTQGRHGGLIPIASLGTGIQQPGPNGSR